MRILSIDVGMKNLAYCLFEIKNKNYFIIEKWDVVNLCTNDIDLKCNGKTKKNIPCNKKPKYYKKDVFFCKTHAKTYTNTLSVPTNDLKEKNIKKCTIKQLKELIQKYNIKLPDKKLLKKDYLDLILDYKNKNYFDFIKIIRAKDFNLVTYGRNLKKSFDIIFKDIFLDCIIIENQIGPLALRMKTLQGMIMQHFIEKKCSIIEEISPFNKLKDFISKKTTYNERKKIGIEITLQKIHELSYLTKWESHFIKHKKKDDLADCFLQGLWYLKSTELIEFNN